MIRKCSQELYLSSHREAGRIGKRKELPLNVAASDASAGPREALELGWLFRAIPN